MFFFLRTKVAASVWIMKNFDSSEWDERISWMMTTFQVGQVVGLLVIGLLGFVFPRITPLLRVKNIQLPLPTRIILRLSSIVHNDWAISLTVAGMVVIFFFLMRRTDRGRMILDHVTLRLPIVGPVIRDVYMARIVTYLSLFYRTGVELVFPVLLVLETPAGRTDLLC